MEGDSDDDDDYCGYDSWKKVCIVIVLLTNSQSEYFSGLRYLSKMLSGVWYAVVIKS